MRKHSVHGLFVTDRPCLGSNFIVERLREFGQNFQGNILEDFILRFGSDSSNSWLERKRNSEEGIGLVDIGRNSSIVMHSENLTRIINGQRFSEGDITSLVCVGRNHVLSTDSERMVFVLDN